MRYLFELRREETLVDFIRNFPFFSIILCMVSAVITSIMPAKWARKWTFFVVSAVGVLSAVTFFYVHNLGEAYVFYMGHRPAPWGNEIRVGVLEALMATFFAIIMFLSLLGGIKTFLVDISEKKQNLYFVIIDLLLSSLLALVYTNDLFTAYVFIEINTIAACALIMIRDNGHCLVASAKYMIMSMLGSGLILIGITLLYDLTGHLLMSNIKEVVTMEMSNGQYVIPLTVTICLLCVGLAIKSALFPFSSWLPDAYGYSTASSAAILSSLVSKGYIFLLIKIFYRVVGFDIIHTTGIGNIFFVFGVAGMISGSVTAMKQRDIRRMIAYSSIAQIGYIYMGIGLGTTLGIVAAVFQILSHGATKSMLFISANGLSAASGRNKDYDSLSGAGHRNPVAGATFTVAAFSMIGIPLLSGFIAKMCFAQAGMGASSAKLIIVMIALAISTILNAVYFIRAILNIYKPMSMNAVYKEKVKAPKTMIMASILFCVLNIGLGTMAQPIINAISSGLDMFM